MAADRHGSTGGQEARVDGEGAVAQGGVAAGRGGVALGGNVEGSTIITGPIVLDARYFERVPVHAIATRMKTTANAISSALSRARITLETCMRESDQS